MSLLFRTIKKWLPLPKGKHPRRICNGAASGVIMDIDFAEKLQRFMGLEEREINADFQRLVLKSKALLDIGSSDGIYPLAAISVNRNIQCLAVDASHEIQTQMRRNLTLNGTHLPVEHIKGQEAWVGAEQVTLDELAATLPRPLLIKMDIDGGELDALSSGLKTLLETNVSLIVEVHSPLLETECIALLNRLGYNCRIVPNAWWRTLLPELRPLELNRWFVAEKIAPTH